VTNAQLFRAIDDLKELFRAEIAIVAADVKALKDDRAERGNFRALLLTGLIAAMVSGLIALIAAFIP
jgi:hypothetical protein